MSEGTSYPARAHNPLHWTQCCNLYTPGDGWVLQFSLSAYPVGPAHPDALAVADFNGDQTLDVATVTGTSDGVQILLNGGGTFDVGQLVPLPAGSQPTALVAGDLNNDGYSDLIVASGAGGGSLTTLLGNTDGLSPEMPGTGIGWPHCVYPGALGLGDFNGDGVLDLVALSQGPSAWVFFGTGSGAFLQSQDLPKGGNYLAIGHLGNPGLDLVLEGQLGLDVLLGSGSGAFEPQGITVSWSAGPLVIGDLDGDGQQDLIAADETDHVIAFFRGKGDGTFSPVQFIPVDNIPRVAIGSLVASDFDGDGRLDLALADSAGLGLGVMWQLPGGKFTPPVWIEGDSGYTVQQPLVAADLNKDGAPDLVVTGTTLDGKQSTSSILILENACP